MKKVLITGAAGFIGFSLSRYLHKNYELTLIDNFSDYYDINLKKKRAKFLKQLGLKVQKIDICNKLSIKKIFSKNKFDIIIHLAAQAGVRYSLEDPDSYINNNIVGSHNLLSLAKENNIKHFMIASTSSVYGDVKTKRAIKENTNSDNPISIYAATKKSVELIAHSYSQIYKIPVTIFRFFTVYGPWGRPDMALFKFLKALTRDLPIDVYNKGNMWRDFTYIEDLCESIKRLTKKPPKTSNKISNYYKKPPYQIVNIGNQKAVKLSYLIQIIEKNYGKKFKKNNLPMQKGDVPFTLSDCSKLKKLINYKPNTKIDKGVKEFIDWYKESIEL